MSRHLLSSRRTVEERNLYPGKILIFCEGRSEELYFSRFEKLLEKNKYTDVKIIVNTVGGNSVTVIKCAQDFFKNGNNCSHFMNYDKYLVFDCDDPSGSIQKVIQDIMDKNEHQFKLLISNHSFEIWLLMHFENVYEKRSKSQTMEDLSKYLRHEYKKADEGTMREIFQKGNIEKAIENAIELEEHYKNSNKNLPAQINEMNPYTTVHSLIMQWIPFKNSKGGIS